MTPITKENYKQLTWDENIPIDDSYSFYQTLDFEEKVEYLKFTLEHFPDYDSEWIEYYFDIYGEWQEAGAWDKLIEFSEFVQEKSPSNYKKQFCYLTEESVLFALFHRDMEAVKKRFAESVAQPEEAIDLTLRSVFNILALDARNNEYTKEVAEKVWKPLQQSSKLIGGAESDYVTYLYCSRLELLFEKISKGEAIDWEDWIAKMKSDSFKVIPEIQQLPKVDLSFDKEKFHQDESFREKQLDKVLIALMYDAYINLGIPTYWVYRSWFILQDYLLDEEDKKKGNNYFTFTPIELDRMGGRLYGMFGGNRGKMFITLWTLPYIYDFLLKRDFIDAPSFQRLMSYFEFNRRELFRLGGNRLWQFAGLFTWQKPNYIAAESWENEKKLFENSINFSKEEAIENTKNYCSSLPELPKEAIPPPPEPSPFERLMAEKKDVPKSKPKGNSNAKNQSRSAARKKRKKKPKRNKKKR